MMIIQESISLTVNRQLYVLPVIPGEKLSDLLRERLHLTGTKIGCGEAKCGTCTVLVDGKPVKSCVYPSERAQGKTVLTIEGLAEIVDETLKLHPLQEAFITHGAIQCGFCTPGQIMTSYALLQEKPNPTKAEIRHALRNNLCRCGAYPAIESAIQAAAKAIQIGESVQPLSVLPSQVRNKTIGQTIIRPDALEKATGSAIYSDDLSFDGMLFASVKRANTPHAILRKLDISKAIAAPGVVAILTAKDIPGKHKHGIVITDWPSMIAVGEEINYIGDALAIIAADTQESANIAKDLIEIEFELLPVVTDPIRSRQSQAPILHEGGNLLKHIKVRKGEVKEGFSEADIVLEHTFNTPTMDHAFMEPECSVAVPTQDGRMEVYVGSQIPYADRSQVAQALNWPEERVRIKGQLMGGGFGGKEDITGQIHAALLANATQRPVKLLFDRHESFLVHSKRHATQIRVKVGAKSDGHLMAIETELYGDTGAYASLGQKVMTRATTHSAGPYNIPHTKADCYAMYTNNPPSGAYRGFGVIQSAFAIESMMDMLASALNIDPITIRRINALKVGQRTNTGQELKESVGLVACIDKVNAKLLELAGPKPFLPIITDTNGERLVTAWGFSTAFKNTGLGGGALDKSGAEVELYPDGTLQVRTSAAELGQGLVTILQMIVAEELEVSPEMVHVLVMDTDLTPDGGPTTASRQTYVTGNAARFASIMLRDAIIQHISNQYNLHSTQINFKDNAVCFEGKTISLSAIATDMKEADINLKFMFEYTAPETKPLGSGGDMHFAYSFACQAAHVEVNTMTGFVRVLKIISANDVGRALNPLGLKGQIEGGIIMGIGHALMEEFVLKDGNLVTDRLSQYPIPTINHVPEIYSFIVEDPTSEGPYGAKGVGEIVSIPTTPAITNAIFNAVGVRIDRLPVKPEELLKAIKI